MDYIHPGRSGLSAPEANYQRILAWVVVSSAFAAAGGLAYGDARVLQGLAAVGIDLLGGIVGGRTTPAGWAVRPTP